MRDSIHPEEHAAGATVGATLTDIIQAVARLDGRNATTLARYGQALRKAGLVAADPSPITVHEAAIILLGIYGSQCPEDVSVAVDRLGDLRHQFTDGPLSDLFDTLVEDKLLDTLANMIGQAPKIVERILQAVVPTPGWDHLDLNEQLEQMRRGTALIDLHVEISSLAAEIAASWGNVQLLSCIFMVDPRRFRSGDYDRRVVADRKVTIGFTLRTILALHEAVTVARVECRGFEELPSQDPAADARE